MRFNFNAEYDGVTTEVIIEVPDPEGESITVTAMNGETLIAEDTRHREVMDLADQIATNAKDALTVTLFGREGLR